MKRSVLSNLCHGRHFLSATLAPLFFLLQSGLYSAAVYGQQPVAGEDESSAVAPIPYKASDFDLGSAITEIVLLLVGLCVVTAVIVVLLRKRLVASGILPEQTAGRIKVLEKKVLSSRTTTHLLEVDGRRVLLCESAGGVAVTILSEDAGRHPETK